MGTIKSGILGGFSGKVGGVVGTSWKGIAVMKAMPQSVANPRTNAQVAQRNAFKSLTLFAAMYLSTYVRPLWNRFAQGMSGYNAFVSANSSNWDADGIVDATSFVLSKGKMAATSGVAGETQVGVDQVDVTWSTAITDSYQQATDDMYALAYNATKNVWSVSSLPVKRSVGLIALQMTEVAAAGNVVHVFLSALRADGTVVSDTATAIASYS